MNQFNNTNHRQPAGLAIALALFAGCSSPDSSASWGGDTIPDAGCARECVDGAATPEDGGPAPDGDAAPGNDASFGIDAPTDAPEPSEAAAPNAQDVPLLFDAKDGSRDYLHTPIPSNPVIDPNSATILANVGFANNPPGGGSGGDWKTPIYVTHASDPGYTPALANASSWGCAVRTPMHIPVLATRETPGNGDAWLVTVNLDTGDVSGLWKSDKSTGTWNATCGGTYPLHGNGFKPFTGVGNGAGAQQGAGIVLLEEMRAGHVDHALYATSQVSCSAFREPATKSDGSGSGLGCMPMGARVQLDPTVDCSALAGATPWEKMFCGALETYGLYILDSGGGKPIGVPYIQGDDLTDPARVPWQIPGDPSRGTSGCAPSPTCGIAAAVGQIDAPTHIPWSRMRILAHWDGT